MYRILLSLMLCSMIAAALPAATIPGSAERGGKLLHTEHCLTCHSIHGQGAKSAPDLGISRGRAYMPSHVVALMWNHAPTMWANMEKQHIANPKLTEDQWADIFAYFHAVRFFERPGDAAIGKQVFESYKCAGCHGLGKPLPNGGPAVATWRALESPIALAQQMWNHASKMRQAMSERKIQWPKLTSQELTDLLVYVKSLNSLQGKPAEFALAAPENGEALLTSKGCTACHTGKLDFQRRLTGATLTDFSVAMWNHAPQIWMYGTARQIMPQRLEQDEMREIVSYLWYTKLYAERGDPRNGKTVFSRKNCAACHNRAGSGAPDLQAVLADRLDPITPITMAAVLWQHGPAMMKMMKTKNLPWPNLADSELLDLIAYLNSAELRRGPESGAKPRITQVPRE